MSIKNETSQNPSKLNQTAPELSKKVGQQVSISTGSADHPKAGETCYLLRLLLKVLKIPRGWLEATKKNWNELDTYAGFILTDNTESDDSINDKQILISQLYRITVYHKTVVLLNTKNMKNLQDLINCAYTSILLNLRSGCDAFFMVFFSLQRSHHLALKIENHSS